MATSQTPIFEGPVLIDSALDSELFWEKNKSRFLTGAAILLLALVATIGWFVKTNQANGQGHNIDQHLRFIGYTNGPGQE